MLVCDSSDTFQFTLKRHMKYNLFDTTVKIAALAAKRQKKIMHTEL